MDGIAWILGHSREIEGTNKIYTVVHFMMPMFSIFSKTFPHFVILVYGTIPSAELSQLSRPFNDISSFGRGLLLRHKSVDPLIVYTINFLLFGTVFFFSRHFSVVSIIRESKCRNIAHSNRITSRDLQLRINRSVCCCSVA